MGKKIKKIVETVMPQPVQSEAEKFWNEIKNLKLEMFALPNQTVSTYYEFILVEPSRLYLKTLSKATSALTALELAIGPKYVVEQADRFVIITLNKK